MMPTWAKLLLLLLLAAPAYADTLKGTLVDANGNAVAGALVTVCTTGSTGTPCTPVVTTSQTGSDGSYYITVAAGTYDLTFTRAGFTPQKLTNVLTGNPVNFIVPGNGVYTGINSFAQIGKTVIVDGTVYPKTDAGINSAITTAGCGGHVFLPAGTYALNDASRTQELLISFGSCTGGFEMNGEGGEQTILQVTASAPNTEDWLRIAPTTTLFGLYLHDFTMFAASGNPGRYGINFDETNGSIAHVTVQRVRVGNSGSTSGNYAVFNTNTVPSCNPLYLTTFEDNTFWGGVNFNNIGDSILFIRNNVTGPRDVTIQSVSTGCHTDGGAHGFQAFANNLTPVGGIVIKNAWQGYFAYNDIEATATSTETNNALIDVQGTGGNAIQNFVIEGNYVGANSAFVADSIRIDQGYHVVIKNNYVTRGSGVAYRITANAARTEITGNTQAPNGELVTTWLADLGSLTTLDSMHVANSGAKVLTNTGFGSNGSSTPNFYFNTVQGRAGSTSVWGWATGTDPSSAGLDTGLSRISANLVGVGNGTQADFSGTLKATSYLNASGQSLGAVIASGTSTLTANATLGAATCQTAVTTAAANVATTDSIEWSFATAPATGDAISPVASYVTSGNVNFTRCNPTAASQNVTAIVINWRVVR